MTTLPKNIDHPCYHDDEAARVQLEAIYWPYGPICPKCHRTDTVAEYGKSMGKGWYWCSVCREQMLVMTLVERGGRARSVKVDDLTSKSLREVLVVNASRKSALHTDELNAYDEPGREFASHETVNHLAKQYSKRGRRGEKVTTNTDKGYFSIFKRGMSGVYQHCSEKHLHRYLSEFDFRYSNRIALGVDDAERAERAMKGAGGRRLTYRQPN